MISREAKALYYAFLSIPMRLNASIYRCVRAPSSGVVKVHLGPGTRNYLHGWINVDANAFTARIDVWADIQHGLPFRDNSVDAIYSHHVIEHLPDHSLPAHFREMYRCLKPGGVIRVGGPNGDSAMRKYLEGDLAWFSDFPDKRGSVGGRLANFIFCRGEHLTILTESYLREIADAVGFVDMANPRPGRETGSPEHFKIVLEKEDQDFHMLPHTLIVEARKPA
jgi:predicted SAM-dependent methyltransferase